MYSSLPKSERSFDVDVVGDTTGVQYKGTFTAKCVLNMAGRHAMELEKTRLMSDYANPSAGLAGISITLSALRAKIVDSPSWWKDSDGGATIIDDNVLLYLYDEVNKLEAAWRKDLKKVAEDTPKGNVPKEN